MTDESAQRARGELGHTEVQVLERQNQVGIPGNDGLETFSFGLNVWEEGQMKGLEGALALREDQGPDTWY